MEDDESILDLVTTALAQQNYIVDTATDGEMGWEMAESFPYDLVLLDIVLPKLDGINLCRRLRDHKKQSLIMLLTAQDAISDKLLGLQSGADDYLVKPFDIQELAARIHALLRRGNPITETVLRCGDLCLNPVACEITYGTQLLRFSRKEYLLLELFLRHQHRVFSRSAIVDQIWSFNEDPPNEDTVKSHIKSIRRKLDAVGAGHLIETLYGQGYRINPAYLAESKLAQRPDFGSNSARQADLSRSMSMIWQRTKSVNLERVTLLEQALEALKAAALSPGLHQAAIQSAHKLVGSLGTFGFESGSKIAQRLETALHQLSIPTSSDRLPDSTQLAQFEQWVQSLQALLQQGSRAATGDRAERISRSLAAHPEAEPLLLLAQDQTCVSAIAAQMAEQALHLITVTTVESAIAQCQLLRPQIAFIDYACLESDQRAIELLELLQADPSVPIVFLSEQTTARTRVNALQAGGQLFLPRSASQALLQSALESALNLRYPAPKAAFRVLVVDDDPLIAQLLAVWLDDSIHLSELTDSVRLWDVLNQVNPDLLILDVNMPEINGIELCQTVRCDLQWNWLPIVFLTAQCDPQTEQQIFAAGADDLLLKPVQPAEFSIRILNRLRRSSPAPLKPIQLSSRQM